MWAKGGVYAVRAIERVPTGSCHFSCLTDPSQSVANFPCVQKRERIKTMCASIAWEVFVALWPSREVLDTKSRRLQWPALSGRYVRLQGPELLVLSPIIPFVFSGWPQGLLAGTE